jgi:hypothetical protein
VPFVWWNVLAILVACIPLARREPKPGESKLPVATATPRPDPTPTRP